jgi:RNA polymerase sigma-70 factor (ECF subfamily)
MNATLPAKNPVFPKDTVRRSPADSIQELIGLRRALLVYARRQVNEPTLAQDLVQDTLEAALRGLHGFEHRSSVSTWAFAILRNHIADHHRRVRTPVPISAMLDLEDDDDEGGHDDARDRLIQLDLAGRDASTLVNTSTPEVHLARQQFWGSVANGMARLSPMQKEVFRLRDLMEHDAAQVSAALGISSNHCHVTLHRARARLRNFLAGHVDRPGTGRQALR